jgi:hypothetical protein
MSQIIRALSQLGSSSRRSTSNRTLCPSTSSNPNIDELNQDEYQNHELEIQEIEDKLANWSLPEIKLKEIYKFSTFEFNAQKIIHTVESATSVVNKYEVIKPLNKELINKHQKDGYKYIHLGLIQVAVKPLHRLGLNTPLLLVLRDTRIKDFHESTIATLESNLNSGPAYFNCHPNFSMSLTNPFTPNSLAICVVTQGDTFVPGVANLDVISRITYKVSKVNYDFKSLKATSKNETCIIEANLNKSMVITPKILTASEIIEKLPEEWVLQNVVKNENPESRSISHTIQDRDGSVIIRMNRSQSHRYYGSSSISSTSSTQPLASRRSIDSTIRVNLTGVNFEPAVPVPLYQQERPRSPSRSPSPTRSQVCNTLTKGEPFEIDKYWIKILLSLSLPPYSLCLFASKVC